MGGCPWERTEMWTFVVEVPLNLDLSGFKVEVLDGGHRQGGRKRRKMLVCSFIVVRIGPWTSGKKVLLSAERLTPDIDPDAETIFVSRTKEAMRSRTLRSSTRDATSSERYCDELLAAAPDRRPSLHSDREALQLLFFREAPPRRGFDAFLTTIERWRRPRRSSSPIVAPRRQHLRRRTARVSVSCGNGNPLSTWRRTRLRRGSAEHGAQGLGISVCSSTPRGSQ